jgi:hypothetical protein
MFSMMLPAACLLVCKPKQHSMKRNLLPIALTFLLFFGGVGELFSQGRLLRRLQQEAEQRAVEEIFGKKEEEKTESTREAEPRRAGRNTRGGGLTQEAPDVDRSMADAGRSFSSRDYTATKAALRDAIWGVELEIGENVLASLPKSISGLQAEPGSDQVTSTGIGFVGLLIERAYSGSDQEMVVTIGNDAALLGVAGYFMAGEMIRQTNDQPNQKQIRFQEHRALIEYDDYSGYTLTAPFGQSSILVLKGVNFGSEQEFMAAANQIDLSLIKQKLGTQ